MRRWFLWVIIRGAFFGALNAFAIHDLATAATFWGAFSLVDLASTLDDAAARRNASRLELP